MSEEETQKKSINMTIYAFSHIVTKLVAYVCVLCIPSLRK